MEKQGDPWKIDLFRTFAFCIENTFKKSENYNEKLGNYIKTLGNYIKKLGN